MRAASGTTWLTLGTMALTAAGRAHAQQPVASLRDALAVARTASWANRVAAGQADERAAVAAGTLRGILPSARVEAAVLRSDEPLAAFAALLHQRTVTAAAFDPARLNAPAAVTDVGAALVVEQPLVNADAWFGRAAARHGAEAARAARAWTSAGTDLDVVRAWTGAVVARRRVATLDTALASARAHQREAESQHRQGTVTAADALLATVRADRVALDLGAAHAAAADAGRRLGLVLGTPADSGTALPADLPAPDVLLALARTVLDDSLAATRADVRAAQAASEASLADARRAAAALLPRANAFGRLDWHDPSSPFGGRRSWTVGVMASWSPFSGGAELAERRAAGARRGIAEAQAEAATAAARADAAAAADELRLAVERLATAERAIGQAGEAHRIVTRKYAGGLATVVEVFDAAATETAARLDEAAARGGILVASAALRRARGLDLRPLLALED